VTPGFIGEIVDNIDRVWVKKVAYTPTGTRFWVEVPGGDRIPVDRDHDEELYFSDGSTAMTAKEIALRILQNVGSNHPAIRDAVTGEAPFEVAGEKPLLGDKALYVKLPVDGQDPILAPIASVLVVGRAAIEVVEMPLTHGGYDGANYSAGEAELGDQSIVSWAVVERGDGSAPQMAGIVKARK
jgi:hypothetical protein